MKDQTLSIVVRLVLAALLVAPGVYAGHYLIIHHERNYSRAAWPNDRTIDPGLADSESALTTAMSKRDLVSVVFSYTDRSRTRQMIHFLLGYAGHPTSTVKSKPGDDNLGLQVVAVTCRPGHTQRVSLTWGWVDAAWRAFPDYASGKNDTVHSYPGCSD